MTTVDHKTCSICNVAKPHTGDNFYRNRSQYDGYHPECKDCSKLKDKQSNRNFYLTNRHHVINRVHARRSQIIEFVRQQKIGKSCSCGEDDARILEYHHIDPSTKSFNIGSIKKLGPSLQRVIAEIAKCTLLCPNCHRKMDNSYIIKRTTPARKLIAEVKLNRCCMVCSDRDQRVLEFHHRDASTKLFNVGRGHYSLEKTLAEIQKCDLYCVNCHRRRHLNEI